LADGYLRENDPYGELANEVALDLVVEKGVEALKLFYSRLQKLDRASIVIDEETVNDLGFEWLPLNRNSDAIAAAVYENRVQAYLQAYLKSGNEAEAIRYHKKAVRAKPSSQQILEGPEVQK
jgi:hypothetical protein